MKIALCVLLITVALFGIASLVGARLRLIARRYPKPHPSVPMAQQTPGKVADIGHIAPYRTITMNVSAYCPCEKCCGQYSDGVTACGHKIRPGDTFVAADRRYSFGTEMLIPGYSNSQPVQVLDRGGAIKGNKLDVFFEDKDGVSGHQRALNWGRQYLEVVVYEQIRKGELK